jgi:hypothetical protein
VARSRAGTYAGSITNAVKDKALGIYSKALEKIANMLAPEGMLGRKEKKAEEETEFTVNERAITTRTVLGETVQQYTIHPNEDKPYKDPVAFFIDVKEDLSNQNIRQG